MWWWVLTRPGVTRQPEASSVSRAAGAGAAAPPTPLISPPVTATQPPASSRCSASQVATSFAPVTSRSAPGSGLTTGAPGAPGRASTPWSCGGQLSQPERVDLADLRRRDLTLGGRVMRHPAVELGQDLGRAAPGGADQEHVPEPLLVGGVAVGQRGVGAGVRAGPGLHSRLLPGRPAGQPPLADPGVAGHRGVQVAGAA